MITQPFAFAYAMLAALPGIMHCALDAAAPLVHFTVGGWFFGRFRPIERVLALLQAGLRAGITFVALARGGVIH
ncbi:hypothetical protein [Meridianimarinicoccus roseus]|uniref:hypothetical protein n=1 Tax=Meridianimarinicoccus roseus TaxID=2072018 RepID=UPI0011B1CA3F|nr:hypothetical protein [Meridianimarinicoccus roseus]